MLPQKLYHIRHNVTGKSYLGQTTRTGKAWDNYFGSSIPFNKHMEEHGRDVTKEILFESSNRTEFQDWCKKISHGLDVVDSPIYLNRVHEYGGNLGGSANPNHKDGTWINRKADPVNHAKILKEKDDIKYKIVKENGLASYRNAAKHAKIAGNKPRAYENFIKWRSYAVKSRKGNALQPWEDFEFWWQCKGIMTWGKRKTFYSKEKWLTLATKYDIILDNGETYGRG